MRAPAARRAALMVLSAGCSLSISTAAQAQAQQTAVPDELVINGRLPHCHMRPGDPLDAVDLSGADGSQQVIRRDPATGQFGLFRDDYPPTDPEEWQRDGMHLDQFVFRVPTDGSPMCIGSRKRDTLGVAQLRRSFAAEPYWGKVLRFTAFVATQGVAEVRFWLAAGSGEYKVGRKVRLGSDIVAGDDSHKQPIVGSHGWMPISYTVGPIPCNATQISYGVTLDGGGDVWMYRAALEQIPDSELPKEMRQAKKFVDGNASCRGKE